MIGNGYFSTGITCTWHPSASNSQPGWAAELTFIDGGFCDDDADSGRVSTEGKLHTRYYVADGTNVDGLTAALDALIRDAGRLGIALQAPGAGQASLYVKGDGENPEVPLPSDWRDQLAAQAERLGWSTYGKWDATVA